MKILYFASSELDYSINAVYIKGLRQNGAEVVGFPVKLKGLKKFREVVRLYFANRHGADYLIVGDDSPELVIMLFLISRKKIVYNALCSVYERLVVSRGLTASVSPKSLYYWLLDFLACRFAHLVMLETDHQIRYFRKLFFLSAKKSFRAWTGVDDGNYFFDPNINKFPQYTVIFRGRLLPEAGGEVAVRAAKLIEKENIKVIMHSFGMQLKKVQALIDELKPANLELVTDFLPIEKVRELMQSCHLSLGQLSDHVRLERTIPHKAYETLALKLPYLTARNPAVLELLEEGVTCLAFDPGSEKGLSEKIIWARDHAQEAARIGQNGYELYQRKLTCKVLAETLLSRLNIY